MGVTMGCGQGLLVLQQIESLHEALNYVILQLTKAQGERQFVSKRLWHLERSSVAEGWLSLPICDHSTAGTFQTQPGPLRSC